MKTFKKQRRLKSKNNLKIEQPNRKLFVRCRVQNLNVCKQLTSGLRRKLDRIILGGHQHVKPAHT